MAQRHLSGGLHKWMPAIKDQRRPGFSSTDQHRENDIRLGHLSILRSISCPQSAPFLLSVQGTTFPRLLCQLVWPMRGTGGRPSLCLPASGETLGPLVAVSIDSSSCQMAPPVQSYSSSQAASAMVLSRGFWFLGPVTPPSYCVPLTLMVRVADLFLYVASQHFHN